MEAKTFDCIEMKRAAALRVYEETKDMSLEKRQAYWRRKNEEFLRKQEARKQAARMDVTQAGDKPA